MGVYVKGMEMPPIGTYEALIDVTNINGKTAISVFLRDENDSRRFSVCVYEAVPVPPHGRLIDADALPVSTAVPFDHASYEYVSLYNIRIAPTVIEAEEGE